MGTQRAHHIYLPVDLISEIDALVGPRGRSEFLVETARKEIKRRRLLEILERETPLLPDEDHPERAELS